MVRMTLFMKTAKHQEQHTSYLHHHVGDWRRTTIFWLSLRTSVFPISISTLLVIP